jgi:hypothetical protein
VRWALPLGVLILTAATGCGAGHRASAGAVISDDGRIGLLRVDRSNRADVIAFVGRPDAERRGLEYDSIPYLALGYSCSATAKDDAFPMLETAAAGRSGPHCKTVFWLNRRTGRLGDFYTASTRFSESHGVHIGMQTARAERLVHELVYVGCEANIHLGAVTIAFTGGSTRKLTGSRGLHLVGGHVYAFAVHSVRNDIGIFDCL